MPAAQPAAAREAPPAGFGPGRGPERQPDDSTARKALLGALAAAGFVVVAFVLEVVGGLGANSPAPAWAELGRPSGLAAGTAGAVVGGRRRRCRRLERLLLARAGIRQRPVVVALTVVPFLVFAAGIATGGSWATWH